MKYEYGEIWRGGSDGGVEGGAGAGSLPVWAACTHPSSSEFYGRPPVSDDFLQPGRHFLGFCSSKLIKARSVSVSISILPDS